MLFNTLFNLLKVEYTLSWKLVIQSINGKINYEYQFESWYFMANSSTFLARSFIY